MLSRWNIFKITIASLLLFFGTILMPFVNITKKLNLIRLFRLSWLWAWLNVPPSELFFNIRLTSFLDTHRRVSKAWPRPVLHKRFPFRRQGKCVSLPDEIGFLGHKPFHHIVPIEFTTSGRRRGIYWSWCQGRLKEGNRSATPRGGIEVRTKGIAVG